MVIHHEPQSFVSFGHQLRAKEFPVFRNFFVLKIFGVAAEDALFGEPHIILVAHSLLEELLELHTKLLRPRGLQVPVSYFPIKLIPTDVLSDLRPPVHSHPKSAGSLNYKHLILHRIKL